MSVEILGMLFFVLLLVGFILGYSRGLVACILSSFEKILVWGVSYIATPYVISLFWLNLEKLIKGKILVYIKEAVDQVGALECMKVLQGKGWLTHLESTLITPTKLMEIVYSNIKDDIYNIVSVVVFFLLIILLTILLGAIGGVLQGLLAKVKIFGVVDKVAGGVFKALWYILISSYVIQGWYVVSKLLGNTLITGVIQKSIFWEIIVRIPNFIGA